MREARYSSQTGKGIGNPFQIDRDRILYSTAFRRLAGVTQVVSPGEGEIFHNRLTHSLKVGQIARRLAEKLAAHSPAIVSTCRGLDADVAEAAGLAHDLGHPPFGHIAEEELQRLVTNCILPKTREGYEGNAQSFRILTELSLRRPESNTDTEYKRYGLDLTRATLNATLKYPWKCGANENKPNKFGAYTCDDAAFAWVRQMEIPGGIQGRSLEAQIMDWADDITYSIHDTEDFYRAGLIPLDRLASNPKERERFQMNIHERYQARGNLDSSPTRHPLFSEVFRGLFDQLPIRERFEGTREQQCLLLKFVADKIDRYVSETKLGTPDQDGETLNVPDPLDLEIRLLKELTWTYVIENPALAAHQRGQKRAIEVLFEVLYEAAGNKRWTLFPASFRERGRDLFADYEPNNLPATERARLVADTIASMTDKQALIVYHQYTGVSPSSMLTPVLS
ncbi:MAG: deoxyguanosinetriphosphate triphosphohydrolase family protein [Gemmataceae bacterium]